MPCCTLIAFLLSQLGIAGGAIKMRLSGRTDLVGSVPEPVRKVSARRRWVGLAAALAVELALAGAAAPYVFTPAGRVAAANSFGAVWHICSVGYAKR